jgi:hypothetical protein
MYFGTLEQIRHAFSCCCSNSYKKEQKELRTGAVYEKAYN